MSHQATTRNSALSLSRTLPQAFFILLGGLMLFTILLFSTLIGFNLYYAGQILPGVSVAGIDLAGRSPQEAATLISEHLTYPETGIIIFQYGDDVWAAKPAQLGLSLDPQNSALAASRYGRELNLITRFAHQYTAWNSGQDLAPLLVYDQRIAHQFINQIAAAINRPTIEAELKVNGTEVTAIPGQVGRSVDVEATLQSLEKYLRNMENGVFLIAVTETPPEILDASAQAETARKILNAPLELRVPDAAEGSPGPWTFDQQTLASMLTIAKVETEGKVSYQVALEAEGLRGFLESIAPEFERQPANARFIFNDETRQLEVIQPAIIGMQLNVDATIQAINENVNKGQHTVDLVLDYSNPAVGDDATAEQLGITELVSAETSYFYGSSGSRIQNIQTAASRFHGILVPPGETFSMAEVMGDVSLDNGYAEALIIFGNRTIKGVGGGVCQVSTTLFRTVFFGGYPVVERHPHAYRVSYYELNAAGNVNPNYAGLDATVYVPVVDFKFINDTPNWLLMETYVSAPARTITWKFYSTSDGRSVDWDTTGLRNIEEPPEPLYQENPDLVKGEIKQVDWAAEGADVSVFRTVYRDNQVYIQDEFSTHYMPWRAVYEYGPGTKLPKDKRN